MVKSLSQNYNSNKGFTLIETLIALAILAIALLAITQAMSENVAGMKHIEEKTYANWVAQNVLAEAELNIIQSPSQGETTMRDKKFSWKVTTLDQDKGVTGIQIHVSRKDQGLITLNSTIPTPQE